MIRLICVIGHGVELIGHFMDHYMDSVDEIDFFVYESDIHPNLKSDVESKISLYTNVKIVGNVYDRVFDWDRVTAIYNEYTNRFPNDWWVIADIDEFHLYPSTLRSIVSTCSDNGWDIVRGGFIDRVGESGKFSKIMEDENIFNQFPNAGFFRYPLSGACPNKICIKKGNIEITSGQHYANINGNTTWRWQGWNHPLIAPVEKYSVQVHHFKWDKTCLKRIKSVSEINKKYAYSSEYKMMYDAIVNSGMKIDIKNPEFMFETTAFNFNEYKQWNQLIKKIISI